MRVKIRYIGLSEPNAAILRRAKAVPDIEKNDFLIAVEETGVSLAAASPLNRGLTSGSSNLVRTLEKRIIGLFFTPFNGVNLPKTLTVVDKVQAIADKEIIPIPGPRNTSRLEDNASAMAVTLSEGYVQALCTLAEDFVDMGGSRYPVFLWSDRDCIPLCEWKGESK
ncbi:hypothetical protein M422DRAFT_251944 [Sphaerobolus stellatus SS14]|uniref:Uncharacterized protein n=1 Tax=Sphaerobolus stellatus (strain SS14) TaxID=990650 RepID=A0A0C9UNQ9_SPHS4|nr:hypothetical protein M422DRAFT_251944 [Sphaerobolus stellatus SS14]